jgi:hypothetical protein
MEAHLEVNSLGFIQPRANMLPHPDWLASLSNVHPSLKSLFSISRVESPLAGRIQKFLVNWKKVSNDPNILNIVKGWEIPLEEIPVQTRIPNNVNMSSVEERATDLEIESMLAKGAIREAIPKQDQFLSNIFVTPKGEDEYRPIVNLKGLNNFVPYHHFKMEGLKDVKNLLRKGDWMCKLDLKDAYFSVPLGMRSRKLVRFVWKKKLYEFLCLAFGLGPAPRVFTKLMKVPVTLLRKLGIRLVIYLDDLLLIASSQKDLEMARDSAMFLFHHLGLTINLKKSVLDPSQVLEFLGICINSIKMTFSLPEKKLSKLKSLCQEKLTSQRSTLRELCSIIGKLRATAPAVIPAPLQLRYLQQVCILAQRDKLKYESMVTIPAEGLLELKWWVNNLDLQKESPLHLPPPDMVICSDAAKTGGWGAVSYLGSTGGMWTKEEAALNINIQELLAAELAIKTFTKEVKPASIHMRIDNTCALSYIVKMGGTGSLPMIAITKRIWLYLLQHKITLTAEWIPTHLNTIADWESRNVRDSAEWKLCPQVFQAICQRLGNPGVDLFASRVSHQVARYFSWKADPGCLAVDAFRQDWSRLRPYAFPPFCLISRVLGQVERQAVEEMIIVTPLWPSQPWYPILLSMALRPPLLLPNRKNLLTNPKGECHPLRLNSSLNLVAWLVSGRSSKVRDCRPGLTSSFSAPVGRGLQEITSQPGNSGYCGVVEGVWIPLHAL